MFKQSLALVGLSLITLSANAALYDRGNGLIYDDVLDITWLQDANYAQTSGYDSDGKMSWYEANTWATQLSYGGYQDWRLPSVGYPRHHGTNVTTSELGHMFYNNLGSPSFMSGNLSFTDSSTGGGIKSFVNVQSSAYWFKEDYPSGAPSYEFAYAYRDYAWRFTLSMGDQTAIRKTVGIHGWAVRDGDVNAVPIPAAAWLFGSALLGLAGVKRRKIHK